MSDRIGYLTQDQFVDIISAPVGASLSGTFEPPIIPGTVLQYWRGDKTWQTLDVSALPGLAAIATSGSATDLIAGTVPAARMPALTGDATSSSGTVSLTLATVNSSPGTFGATNKSLTATVNGKGLITALSAANIAILASQVTDFSTGVGLYNSATATKLLTARTIGITGDGTWSSGSFDGSANVTAAFTLSTVNANTGSWGTATQSPQFTVNGKGLITAATNVTITPAFSSLTGKPTTLSGYGITDGQPLDSDLTTIAGLTATTDNFIVSVSSAWASRTPAQVKTTLGLVIGTNVQAWDTDLDTWAAVTRASGFDTFTATPSSANLKTLITDETGSGALVFATSPTLVTPILGTPSSGTLTSCTGLPISTGLTGAGTGVLTALGVNVGSAGAFVTFNGAGGTPSSLVLTNATGTPTLTTPIINGLPTGTGVASAATVSTLMSRDSNGNSAINNLAEAFTTTATAAGTTTLTITATYTQVFTGSSTQTVKLPTTSVLQGQQYLFINQSTGAVTVQSSGANTIIILAASTSVLLTAVVATPTTAANWNASYAGVNAASGKVVTINNTLTFSGTDATTMTFPSTSATIARTDAANTFTGHQTIEGVTSTGATGTGKLVFDGTPTLQTPNIGTATGTAFTPGTSFGTFASTTNARFFYNSSFGCVFGGVGSVLDMLAVNSAGSTLFSANTGTQNVDFANNITVAGTTTVTGAIVGSAAIRTSSYLRSTAKAVGSLTAAGTAGAGARDCVTDALAPTFGATVVGGGAITTPVYSDGTNWKVG